MSNPQDKKISIGNVPLADTIASLAASSGITSYLVGGAVRNLLLGIEAKDFDFVISEGAGFFPKKIADVAGGSFFWLDQERLQSRVVVGRGIETITIDFAPVRGGNIESDLRLRDFTINAMAVEVGGGGLIDPLGGRNDLARGVIRVCADSAFDDDPLRMLRAFRFAATLGFAIEPGTVETIRDRGLLLAQTAPERVRDEVFKILDSRKASAIMAELSHFPLFPLILPVEPSVFDVEGLSKVEDVLARLPEMLPEEWGRASACLQREVEGGVSGCAILKLAALLRYDEGAIGAVAGFFKLGRNAAAILSALGSRARPIQDYAQSGRAHFRFVRDHRPAVAEILVQSLVSGNGMDEIAAARRLLRYFFFDYDDQAPDLLVSGRELMERFGLPQGPALGKALEALRQGERTGEVTNREEAFSFLEKKLLTKA